MSKNEISSNNNKINKWWSLIGGILSIACGIFFFNNTIQSLILVAMYLAVFIMIKGVTSIFAFFKMKGTNGRGLTLALGIIDIVIACMLFNKPFVTVASIPFIFGFWILFTSIIDIAKSFEQKSLDNPKWWILLLTGAIGIFAAIYIMNNPISSAITIVWIMGIYFVAIGIVGIFNFFTKK